MTDSLLLKIAGFKIKIIFNNGDNISQISLNRLQLHIQSVYRGFISINQNEQPDHTIEIYKQHPTSIEKKINGNHLLYFYLAQKKPKHTKTFWHISISQFVYLVSNILQDRLVKNGGFTLHASANIVNGKVVLFIAPSGGGKSTVTKYLNDRYNSFSDDGVYVRIIRNKLFAYQTPVLVKKHFIAQGSQMYEIDKIFFLRKKPYFNIKKINSQEMIINKLVKQLWSDQQSIKKQMGYLFKASHLLGKLYILSFVKSKIELTRFLGHFFNQHHYLQHLSKQDPGHRFGLAPCPHSGGSQAASNESGISY